MKNKITSLMILIILLLFTPQLHNKVSAEEYEKNILISCESKEIDINDIPENREVELNVSIENNPGFILLGMYVKYDLRLEIDDYDLCKTVEGEDGAIYQAGASFTEGEEGYTRICINTKNLVLSDSDGIVTAFKFKIPTDAKIGDEYKVEFITNRDHLTFFFTPNNKDMYREEYFPNHHDGLIKIVGTASETINSDVTQSKEDDKIEPEVSDQFVTEASQVSNVETSENTTEVITSVSTGIRMTEQTSITSVPETAVTTIPVTSSSTEASILVESTSSTSQNSTLVTEKTEHDEVNKRSYIIPVALVAVILAVSAALTVNRQRRSK